MSYHEYLDATELVKDEYPFYALIMAAYARADSGNAARLRAAFPSECAEMDARYNSPGGTLPDEHFIRERLHKRASQDGQASTFAASPEATGP